MKCKNCRSKFEPRYFNQKFCLKDECIKVFVEVTKNKEWTKRKKEIKRDLETVQDLMKATQLVFNKYIRLRDKGSVCISCQKPPKKENAGHFVASGKSKYLTFNEDNVHLQCEYCNTHLSANLIEYRIHLITKIGLKRVEWLEANRNKTIKYTREELRELIIEYKQKIKDYQ